MTLSDVSNTKAVKFGKWWRGWGGAITFALGLFVALYVCGATGLLDKIGDLIEWARQANCSFMSATGNSC